MSNTVTVYIETKFNTSELEFVMHKKKDADDNYFQQKLPYWSGEPGEHLLFFYPNLKE